ncbi:uncharacterized protein LOC124127889 isoform X1 [Haliotis rufescens]|uniref:uncharacterized protein LOC124127889 isoform X1 n=1 Tax=Haliotis rufescens TaxID=6454 RepID=UPI00201F68DB|nr:uncharacterized protein LOC124127889 isoform X1 [Haliotis rufescens]XP_048246157.1 uncharacterized protein LOC124127889 isoform X1 [Haliotis rufescens]
MKGERNATATLGCQNTSSPDTVDNELYEGSPDISSIKESHEREEDFIMTDGYANVDVPATNTPQDQVAPGNVNLENLYAKPDKTRITKVPHVSDIYAEVKKPKKKKQGGPIVSGNVNTGDVYAKPIKERKTQI